MNVDDGSISRHSGSDAEATEPRTELIRRVVSSSTFEKSPKLRAFLQYVCQCALHNEPEAATEQQIGIHVFGRNPGYNPNEDNIVRSQARLLRLKLEHHFAHEGRGEPVIITIPKGRYLPAFEKRVEEATEARQEAVATNGAQPQKHLAMVLVGLAVVFGLAIVWLLSISFRSKTTPTSPAAGISYPEQPGAGVPSASTRTPTVPDDGAIRIAAGNMGAPYTDVWGRRWDSDQYYLGGVAHAGPQDLFPVPPDPGIFKNIREGTSTENVAMQGQSGFRYDIPVPTGVYELRLYFADPVRRTALENRQDAENVRHFNVDVNGRRMLSNFDAIAGAGLNSVDIRAFKDVTPAGDGKVHIEFVPSPERPFVNALELLPGTQGKMEPIRLSAHNSDFLDGNGIRWSADNYYINGRSTGFSSPETAPKLPELYSDERYGNFSYAIPVPPGSYTVNLHFMETFFVPTQPNGLCQGAGCRVFDVSCNNALLLKDFDVFQAAGGGFRPVVRVFHNLHPNGQGKLFLSFTPRINYAEVRAIEVIDEGH